MFRPSMLASPGPATLRMPILHPCLWRRPYFFSLMTICQRNKRAFLTIPSGETAWGNIERLAAATTSLSIASHHPLWYASTPTRIILSQSILCQQKSSGSSMMLTWRVYTI